MQAKKSSLGGIRVPANLAKDVASDAKGFKKSKDGIVQVALQNLFCFKREERAKLYARLPDKIFGRPIL